LDIQPFSKKKPTPDGTNHLAPEGFGPSAPEDSLQHISDPFGGKQLFLGWFRWIIGSKNVVNKHGVLFPLVIFFLIAN